MKKVTYKQAKQRFKDELGINVNELRENVFPISEDQFQKLLSYYRTKIKKWKSDVNTDDLPF